MPRPVSHIDLLAPLLADSPEMSVLQNQQAWSTIKRHASNYGVGALIAYAVRPHVSGEDRKWCDRILTESWVRHERMLQHLDHLLMVFEADDIPVLALKGPLLARRYWKPPFLRKASMDLDIAVAAGDLQRACRALENEGYKLAHPIGDVLIQSHDAILEHPSRPRIELHFRLSHRALGIPVDELFERAIGSRLPSGTTARVLGPADQLLHLILHLAHSRFGTLFHLYEVRRICRAEPPEVLAEAVERAMRNHYCGVLRMMEIAFRTRWGEPFLPPGVRVPNTWLNRRLTPKLFRTFESWSLPGREMSLAGRIYARWLDFQLTDRPVDALRAAAFFFGTAKFYAGQSRAWGTVKHLRFAHESSITNENAESEHQISSAPK